MSRFVVTTVTQGGQRSLIWDDKSPMGIGHPFRYVIERTEKGIQVRHLSHSVNQIADASLKQVPKEQLDKGNVIALEPNLQLKIRKMTNDLTTPLDFKPPATELALDNSNLDFFVLSGKYTAVAFVAFLVMAYFWPKPQPKPAELIPEQFTQIVMPKQPATKAPAPAAGGETAPKSAQNLPKKVENAAVVQAFRAKALQSAVSKLLKGGMTNLMAQSDFVRGNNQSLNARNILNTKSNAMHASASATGDSNPNVQVAAVGGEGGKGVGYRKGDKAGVEGQGKNYVKYASSITGDSLGADVQEGLTKDEVGEVIHKHMSEIRYCYETAMMRTPDIEGKLIVDFTIGGNGMVKATAVKTSTIPDPRLDDCILRRLVTWKFPLPKGGIDVAVSYPFIFKTLGR